MQFLGKYIIELSLVEYKMIKYSPILIACSTLYLIIKMQKFEGWSDSLEQCTRHAEIEMKQCSKELYVLLQNAEKTSFQVISKKFSSRRFMEIAKQFQERN